MKTLSSVALAVIAGLVMLPVPLPAGSANVAQAQSWNIAIEQFAMVTTCGSQTNIPVPGAISLGAAITAGTGVFNSYFANCVKLSCPQPNSTVTTGAATGFADPYIVNGNPRTRYQITIAYTCNPPAAPRLVPFNIRKVTGAAQIAGTYSFTVSCTGPGGPYTTPVNVVLPAPGVSSVSVPAGSACTVKETGGRITNAKNRGATLFACRGRTDQISPIESAGGSGRNQSALDAINV